MVTLIVVWLIVSDLVVTYSQCKFNARMVNDIQALKDEVVKEAK